MALARDLTLPRLRPGWPDTPAEAATAAGEWRAAWRGRRPLQRPPAGVSEAVADEATWARYAAELGSLREQLRAVPVDDADTWAQVAHTTAGAFAAWSLRVEGDRPGPLAATAAALARTGQVRAGQTAGAPPWGASRSAAPPPCWCRPPAAAAARSGRRCCCCQLSNTAKAIHDMHAAAGRTREAAAVADAVRGQLAAVRDRLPDPDLVASLTGDRSAAADAARLGTAHHTGATHTSERPLGSPLPAPLTPRRGQRPVGPAPGQSRGEELGR